MRDFSPKAYQDLFDDWNDPVIQAHMADEFRIIEKIENKSCKTFIDLGAGHGRVLSKISPLAKNVVSIEINSEMFKVLQEKAQKFFNVKAILGDITNFDKIVKKLEVINPALLILQNTLGTIEGEYQKALEQMK